MSAPKTRTIHVTIESCLSADRVLAAGVDFSERREEAFPAVSMKHMEVHELGATSADVTEGTFAGIGVNWERCRYDWSQPNSVMAKVIDSNVYAPRNSSWELRATPSDGGSTVEMIWIREFATNARGRIFGTLFRLLGKPIFSHGAKEILKNLEKLEAAGEEHRYGDSNPGFRTENPAS